jgi:hypothetical protein
MTFKILGLVVSVVVLAFMLWCERKESIKPSLVWPTIIFSCLALGSLVSLINHNEPTALDVYQGKTTLEITYRDSVAIDSTVVYKVR